jgi:NADH-quinone oxidoreductase subunit C
MSESATSEPAATLAERLRQRFDTQITGVVEHAGQTTIDVRADAWLEVARALHDEATLRFEQAVDLCGVDYLSFGEAEWDTTGVSNEGFSRGVEGAGPGRFRWSDRPAAAHISHRFAVVVHLLSITHNQRLRIRCFVPDEGLPVVHSLTSVWRGLNWFEREAFDMFGIIFEGHSDLRRILTDYGFVGHPFRKDFPLIGNVEVRYDEERRRVVYEPVSIEPRVGVPRTVRDDARLEQAAAESAARAAR